MPSIKISVVIPTCDRPYYLLDALNSVVAQTYPVEEILVVDNGREEVNPLRLPQGKKLKIIRALPRFGVSQARNLGAILAKGDYIAFLDDDDAWDQDYLKEVHKTAEETGADVVLGRLRDGRTRCPIKGKQASFDDRGDLIRQILLRNPGAVGSNTTVRRSCFAATAGYDPWITTGQDKGLVLDLLFKGALPARATDAWVDFRDDGVGPRQTDLKKRIEGKRRFLQKYRLHMSQYQRWFNIAQLLRLKMGSWLGKL